MKDSNQSTTKPLCSSLAMVTYGESSTANGQQLYHKPRPSWYWRGSTWLYVLLFGLIISTSLFLQEWYILGPNWPQNPIYYSWFRRLALISKLTKRDKVRHFQSNEKRTRYSTLCQMGRNNLYNHHVQSKATLSNIHCFTYFTCLSAVSPTV